MVRELERALEATAHCRGMIFNIALNYSGRCEIVDACRRIVADWAAGKRADIDEETLGRYLYTAGQPDPDLLIRTSGELRVSNFLLWQIAYAEIWVTPTLWPDFRRRDLFEAILAFQQPRPPLRRRQDPRRKSSLPGDRQRLRPRPLPAARRDEATPHRRGRRPAARCWRSSSCRRCWFFVLLVLLIDWAALEFVRMVRPAAPNAPLGALLFLVPLAAAGLVLAPLDAARPEAMIGLVLAVAVLVGRRSATLVLAGPHAGRRGAAGARRPRLRHALLRAADRQPLLDAAPRSLARLPALRDRLAGRHRGLLRREDASAGTSSRRW